MMLMTSRSTADVFDGTKIPVLSHLKDCQIFGAPKLQLCEFYKVKQATIDLAEFGEPSREGIKQNGNKEK